MAGIGKTPSAMGMQALFVREQEIAMGKSANLRRRKAQKGTLTSGKKVVQRASDCRQELLADNSFSSPERPARQGRPGQMLHWTGCLLHRSHSHDDVSITQLFSSLDVGRRGTAQLLQDLYAATEYGT